MKNSGMNGDLNPDLCDAGVVLHKLSYWANWEQVTVWVDYKPVDAEIDDDNTGIFSTYLNCRYKEWMNLIIAVFFSPCEQSLFYLFPSYTEIIGSAQI